MKPNTQRIWIIAGVFLAFFWYFVHNIDSIPFYYWDEQYYINAARAYLLGVKPYPNPEHPPLAKELIAGGIFFFGDGPMGWRLASALCGALTCTMISYLTYRWSKSLGIGLFLALLLFLDPMIVVNSRISMLETPLMAALMLSTLADYLFLTQEHPTKKTLYFWGVAAGLALSVKFTTLAFFPIWWGLAAYHLKKQGAAPKLWVHGALALCLVPVMVLFLSYLVLGYSPFEVADLMPFMWGYHHFHKGPSMAISRWYEWFWIKDPIWYLLQPKGTDQFQGVLLTGNLVLWIGALLASFYLLIRKYREPVFWLFALPILFQIVLYSRKPSTFFFYMSQILPFLYLLLGGALGDLWNRWGKRYGTILKLDFGLLWVAALIVFLNYWPFLWGQPFSRQAYQARTGQVIGQPVPASPTHSYAPESQESTEGHPEGQ